MAIKLNTGVVPFDIKFDNGETGTIYFNPTDPDLTIRFSNAYKNITERVENLEKKDIQLNNDGSVELPDEINDYENLTDEQQKELMNRVNFVTSVTQDTRDIMCEELNSAFASDVSSVVFKYCSPLAIVDGEYMIIQFLKAISPEIKKHIEKANKDSDKKKQKHISKYKQK